MGAESKVIEFKCSSCGGSMQSSGHSNGKVVCPWCNTECVIDGLIKNAEILAKENINSGVSIDLEKKVLNSKVIDALTSTGSTFPLDILESGTVVMKKHICVPAYLFYCNGMASYTYEVAVERERTSGGEVKGNKVKYTTETYTEWLPMGGTATTSGSVIVSGNRNYTEIINRIYAGYNANNLVDIESLVLPTDVETLSFNLPQPAAFSEYVNPRMEAMLVASAENTLHGKKYRNFTLGGCNIQKSEVLRLSLGIYQIAFQYNGKIYTLFMAGDGSAYYWDEQPVDQERVRFYEDKIAAEKKRAKSPFLVLAIICTVLAFFTYGIALLPGGLFGYLHFKRKSERKNIQAKIDAFIAEANNKKQQFVQNGRTISGL